MQPLFPILVYGLTAGVITALPVGPATVMLLSHTLRGGVRGGAAILGGLLLVELTYVLLFMLGFDAVLEAHPLIMRGVGLAGSALLLALGLKTLRRSRTGTSAPTMQETASEEESLWSVAGEAVLIAAINPAILFFFAGVISGATTIFSAGTVHAHLAALLLSMEAGVFAWLGLLVWLTASIRRRMTDSVWQKLDLATGLLLALFGLAVPLRLLFAS